MVLIDKLINVDSSIETAVHALEKVRDDFIKSFSHIDLFLGCQLLVTRRRHAICRFSAELASCKFHHVYNQLFLVNVSIVVGIDQLKLPHKVLSDLSEVPFSLDHIRTVNVDII